MKKVLLFILIFMSNNVFSDVSPIESMFIDMDNNIKYNSVIIDKLSQILLKKILIFFRRNGKVSCIKNVNG